MFLGDLVKLRRGTKEVEHFLRKQEGLRHEKKESLGVQDTNNMVSREKEIVVGAMVNKFVHR